MLQVARSRQQALRIDSRGFHVLVDAATPSLFGQTICECSSGENVATIART